MSSKEALWGSDEEHSTNNWMEKKEEEEKKQPPSHFPTHDLWIFWHVISLCATITAQYYFKIK